MTEENLINFAIKKTIGILEECDLKYRKNDFNRYNTTYVNRKYQGPTIMKLLDGGVVLTVFYDDLNNHNRGIKLKRNKDKFYNYFFAHVDFDCISFKYTKKELELEYLKQSDEGNKNDEIMKKIQKLLALAESDNEHEAISASLMAQKLLAKYNITLEKNDTDEEIREVTVKLNTGDKWKYNLGQIIANNYCCKFYWLSGGETIVTFRGYITDIMIARRVFTYLFSVGKRLAKTYEKNHREEHGFAYGIYNSYCSGYLNGIEGELNKQCTALQLVIPKEVEKDWDEKFKDIKTTDTNIPLNDYGAFKQGETDGKNALNAQYIDDNSQYIG